MTLHYLSAILRSRSFTKENEMTKFQSLKIYCFGLLVYAKWIIIILWNALRKKDYQWCIAGFAHDGMNIYRKKLNINVEIENIVQRVPNAQPIIIVGNHPTSAALFGVAHALTEIMPTKLPTMVFATKHQWHPLGWALSAMKCIAINRNNTEKALRSLREGIRKIPSNGMFIIYPEGHRPQKNRILANQQRLRKKGNAREAHRYRFSLSGRPQGIMTLRKALPNATWIRMYVIFDHEFTGYASEMGQIHESTLHIHLSAIDPPPMMDREKTKQWLHNRLLGPFNDWADMRINQEKQLVVKSPKDYREK